MPKLQFTTAALGLLLLAGPVAAQSRQGDTVDIDFAGGSVVDFVEAVRKSGTNVNVVLTPFVETVSMPAVQLRGVPIGSALQLLEGVYETPAHDRVELEVRSYPGGPGGVPVYKIESQIAGRGRTHVQQSKVWSLTNLIATGRSAADVLTAIEVALELYEQTARPAELRFHRETSLLLARASVDQINTIDSVVDELNDHPPANDRESKLKSQNATMQGELAKMTSRANRLSAQLDGLRAEFTICQTQGQFFRNQIESLETQRNELQREVSQTLISRDAEIAKIRLIMNSMEMRLSQKK